MLSIDIALHFDIAVKCPSWYEHVTDFTSVSVLQGNQSTIGLSKECVAVPINICP